jgi:hypothetical protein
MSISPPGTRYSPCGKWGCGDHGECRNNVCVCTAGWSGVHCEVPPLTPPNPNIGDFECGNWGVYGTLTLNPAGYAPTCTCASGMTGTRCERECDADADCGSGSCDEFGRCSCAQSCLSDANCALGVCESGKCTNGWAGIQCTRALSNECTSDECGPGGQCVNAVCVCDQQHTGLRCETPLAATGEPCTRSGDCADAVRNDVCVDNTCQHFGTDCRADRHCRVVCRDGICTLPTVPPDMSEMNLDQQINAMLDELATPTGVGMMLAEEALESAPAMTLALYSGNKIMRKIIKRALAKRSATVAVEGMAPVVTRSAMRNAVQNISAYAARKGITAGMLKASNLLNSKPVGALFFAIQVVGMVLDVDDAAGFNMQMSGGAVDAYMQKILKVVNEDPNLREAGVQFPRQYLPDQTLEWRAKLQGDVADETRHNLILDYIAKLDVNANGATIRPTWQPLATDEPPSRNPVLWAVSGRNSGSYSFLRKWWWLILVLGLLIVVTIGLGVGLSARKRNKVI